MFLSILLVFALSVVGTEANVDGAPEASCYRWLPFHHVWPRLGYPVFKISVEQTSDVSFDVTLESRNGTDFLGFFLSVRHPSYGIEPMGIWDVEAATDFQARPCPNSTFPPNGITHVANNPISSVTATWFMDERLNGTDDVYIKGSVAEDFWHVYAVRAPLVEKVTTTPPTTPAN